MLEDDMGKYSRGHKKGFIKEKALEFSLEGGWMFPKQRKACQAQKKNENLWIQFDDLEDRVQGGRCQGNMMISF